MKIRPKVGIFQGAGALQSQVVNAIAVLDSRGYDVDIFFFNVSRDFCDVPSAVKKDTVRIFDYNDSPDTVSDIQVPVSPFRKKIREILRAYPRVYRQWQRLRSLQFRLADSLQYWFHVNDLDFVIPRRVLDQTKSEMAGHPYRCLIGVEKFGLVWAGAVAQEFKIPLVYYSLELYTQEYFTPRLLREFPGFASRWFRRLKRLEQKYHQQCQATIVQDADRKQVLLRDNRIDVDQRCFFVPVSLLGSPSCEKKDLWRSRWGIPQNTRVLLYFGLMRVRRYALDLVRLAQTFPEDWMLVMHGHAPEPDMLRALHLCNTHNRAIISTTLVPSSEIDTLIASADIGLVFYSNETKNEFLTGKSSEKVALYARAGVPMIAFDYPSFVEVFSKYRCGRCISRIAEIEEHAKAIFADYERYRQGALLAYVEVYEFAKHFSAVVDWIDQL